MKKYRKVEKLSPEIKNTPFLNKKWIFIYFLNNICDYFALNLWNIYNKNCKKFENSFFVEKRVFFLIYGGGFSTFLYLFILFPHRKIEV